MSGVFLLATHGEAGGLMISKKALFFALASALCVVVYNVSAKGLLRMYPVSLVLGWGMLIGGVILGAALGVWNLRGASDAAGFAAFLHRDLRYDLGVLPLYERHEDHRPCAR